MPRRRNDDELRSNDPADHFEPYRPYDPTRSDNDEDEEDPPRGIIADKDEVDSLRGIIAGPDANDADLISDDEEVTVECPKCGYVIWGEAEQCTLCGEWLTARRNPWIKVFVVAVVSLLILAILLWWHGLWSLLNFPRR
jgi:hypothetical protein